jgi:hypothetical protein
MTQRSTPGNAMTDVTDIADELEQQIPDNRDYVTFQIPASQRDAVVEKLRATFEINPFANEPPATPAVEWQDISTAPKSGVIEAKNANGDLFNVWWDDAAFKGFPKSGGIMCVPFLTHWHTISIPPATPAVGGEVAIDEIVTRLYRRFKDWSRRGFGPEDVTWCEVKEDISEMIRAAQLASPLRGSVNECVLQIIKMSPADQFDLAFKVAENVGYMLVRAPEHPDSPHLAAQPATPVVGGEALDRAAFQLFCLDNNASRWPSVNQDQYRKEAKSILDAAQPASPLRTALEEIRSLADGDLSASVSAIMAIRHVLETTPNLGDVK